MSAYRSMFARIAVFARLRLRRRGCRRCFRSLPASIAYPRVEYELHFDRFFPELRRKCADPAGKLGFHPVQLEAVRCGNTQPTILEIERSQRFDPGTELLRRQFLLQLRGAGLPEIFH